MSGIINNQNLASINTPQKSAFGEMMVASPETLVQLQFPYELLGTYETVEVGGSGSSLYQENFAGAQSGASSISYCKIQSKDRLHYQPGQGLTSIFTTIFSAGVDGNTQIAGCGNDQDGFFFGYNGTTFGILHRNNNVDTWIPQSAWNIDILNGIGPSGFLLDPQRGNVYKIQFQWLGFGAINFYIENENTGTLRQVHQIKFANANTSTSLANPSLQLMIESRNTTHTGNVIVKTPSMAAYVEGQVKNIDTRFSIRETGSFSTQGNLVTIRDKSSFRGKTNQTSIIFDTLSIYNAASANSDAIYSLYIDATLGGTPAYSDVNANQSVAEYDSAGTTVTNGRKICTFYLGGTRSEIIYLSDLNIKLTPGQTLTVTGESLSSAIDLFASLSWQERF